MKEDDLKLYRRAFRKLAKYLGETTPGYSFRFVEEENEKGKIVWLQVKTPRRQKWGYIDSWNPERENIVDSYEDMRQFLCRNMSIEIDDYSEVEYPEDDGLVVSQRESRVRRFLRFPCYNSLIEMIMKLGLKGIDIS